MEEFAAKIVAAYVRNNPVSPEDLPRVIGAVVLGTRRCHRQRISRSWRHGSGAHCEQNS
jgi:predicted transcriptional regulator